MSEAQAGTASGAGQPCLFSERPALVEAGRPPWRSSKVTKPQLLDSTAIEY